MAVCQLQSNLMSIEETSTLNSHSNYHHHPSTPPSKEWSTSSSMMMMITTFFCLLIMIQWYLNLMMIMITIFFMMMDDNNDDISNENWPLTFLLRYWLFRAHPYKFSTESSKQLLVRFRRVQVHKSEHILSTEWQTFLGERVQTLSLHLITIIILIWKVASDFSTLSLRIE